MALLKLYNQAGQDLKTPQRVIFFADSGSDKKGPRRYLKTMEEETTSPEFLTYCKELDAMEGGTYGRQVADQFRAGKIEGDVLKELREVLRNPDKMKNNEYKWFMKAVGSGKFPKRAKNALHFLNALESPFHKERDRAKEFIRNLSEENTGPLSERREKDILQELTDLREEDISEETLIDTSSKAAAITQSADVQRNIEKLTQSESLNHWEIEKAPEGLMQEIARIKKERHPLAEEAKKKYDQLKEAQLKGKLNHKLIEKLQTEIAGLNQKIDKLTEELKPNLEKIRAYYQRNLLRFRALERFFKRAGLDVKTAERIKLWFISLSGNQQENEKRANLKLMGIKVDPGTGRAYKEETTIEIIGLTFDQEKSEDDPEAPGTLHVQYLNEIGEKCECSYKNFLDIINTYEAYEEIREISEVNKRISEENGHKNLAVGQEFTAKFATDLDEKGEKIYKPFSFIIEDIDEKQGTIKLNNTILKTPKEWLPFSAHDSLYFDRFQKTFNFGEFVKLVKQHNFQRKVHIDETQEICDKTCVKLRDECFQFVKNESEEKQREFEAIGGMETGTLTVPSAGQSKEVFFVDNNDLKYWGKLSRRRTSDGEEAYHLEVIPDKHLKTNFVIEDLENAGIPSFMIATNWGKARPTRSLGDQKLSPHDLAALLRTGRITNAPETMLTSGGKIPHWTLKPQPLQKAALAVSDKYAGIQDALGNANFGNAAHGPASAVPGSTTTHPTDESSETAPRREHGPGETPHDESTTGEEYDVEHDTHGQGDHDDHKAGENATHGAHDAPKKFRDPALPYEDINKVGGTETKELGFLKSLWVNSRFLSMGDLWTMGKTMWEYYDRRFERNQKDKFARVGEEIPYFAPEMRRIVESTEHEAVNQFQEAFNHKGIFEIRQRMRTTRNKDELKATLIVLSEKGELNWMDVAMWDNINKWTKAGKYIPIPSNRDPFTKQGPDDDRTGFDYLKDAIDSIWGEGNFNGWYQKNKSAFASNAKSYYEEGKELEGVQGGHEKRLGILLKLHKQGHYVNPHEYEGLILHSIEAGKSNIYAKLYFMIEGVAAVNGNGDTILPFDRIAHINSEMLTKFPILEYVTARIPRPPKGKVHRFTLDDYKEWVRIFDKGDPGNPNNHKPNSAVSDFVWNYVIPSEDTLNRINKVARNMENLDHDDMNIYVPPLDYENVTYICGSSTGNKKYLTVEGYANIVPGFSQYMRTLAGIGKKDWLKEAVKSYVRIEGIFTNRYDAYNKNLVRLTRRTLNSGTIVSDITPQEYMDQMNAAVKEIIEAYNNTKLNDIAAKIYQPEVSDLNSKEGKETQEQMDTAFKQFNKVFDEVVKSDNGQKMLNIILRHNLFGTPDYKDDATKEARKKLLAKSKDELALE